MTAHTSRQKRVRPMECDVYWMDWLNRELSSHPRNNDKHAETLFQRHLKAKHSFHFFFSFLFFFFLLQKWMWHMVSWPQNVAFIKKHNINVSKNTSWNTVFGNIHVTRFTHGFKQTVQSGLLRTLDLIFYKSYLTTNKNWKLLSYVFKNLIMWGVKIKQIVIRSQYKLK